MRIGDPDRFQRGKHLQQRSNLERCLSAGADDQSVLGILSGQIFCTNGSCRTSAHSGHRGAVHKAKRHTGFRAEHGNQTHKIRQAFLHICFHERNRLVAENMLFRQITGFNIHICMAGVEFIENGGPYNGFVLTFQLINILCALDRIFHRKIFSNFFCGNIGNIHRGSPFFYRVFIAIYSLMALRPSIRSCFP